MVYVVEIKQQVQSWHVIRTHDDFVALGNALSLTQAGLPTCPQVTDVSGPGVIIMARNSLQEWLLCVLMHPIARESEAVANFLTMGANEFSPQYEGVVWTQFNPVLSPASSHSMDGGSPHLTSGRVDEMEMDEMFLPGDDDGLVAPEDQDDFDEDIVPTASERYKAVDEAVTDQDELDIMQGDVEMIEDIGSLAQSLGASHLGRSLNLQAEMKFKPAGGLKSCQRPQSGLNIGGASSHESPHGSGLSGVMAQAAARGDTFNRRPLESAPRLDSFRMERVIGKGSFGKFLDCALRPALDAI